MPVQFKATIHRFKEQGDKTGWTYIEVPADIAEQLKKGTRQSFRVKGKLDEHKISGISLIPMGGGRFILTLNATLRKAIGKSQGAMVQVSLQEDKRPFVFNKDFIECLADDPPADEFFKTLTGSHQRYFSKWIDDAKGEATKTRRIAMAVSALSRKLGYGEMLRAEQERKKRLL